MNINRRDLLRMGAVGAGGLTAARVLTAGSRLGLAPGSSGATAGRLVSATPPAQIIPRSAWGADETRRTAAPLFAPVRQFFVHHTVTANNDADPTTTIRSIYSSHLAQGFHDIGYNFLIDASGNLYEGRYARTFSGSEQPNGQGPSGLGVVGAHVAGHNVGTVGIGLLGEFSRLQPAPAALNALVSLLVWLADQYGLDPSAFTEGEPVIAGHRDANQTACPGDDLYNQLPAIRLAVASRLMPGAPSGPPLPPTCVQLIPAGVTATPVPRVTGQVSRSTSRVDVTFSGSGLLSQRTISVPPNAGTFAVEAGHGLGGLSTGSYSVEAVAFDASGRGSAATAVASGYRVVSANLPSGYWVLGSDGGVFSYGGASFLGSTGGMPLNKPVIGMAATARGDGYWLVASDGGIFAFGAARFFGSTGSIRLNKPIVGISTSATGQGYRLVASDGGIFSFGDAPFFGSTGSLRLNAPIVGMAATPSGGGYWLVASDGGIFSFGDAAFFGSAGGQRLGAPIAGIEPTPSGRGYWLVGGDGAVFNFGDARNFGSVGPGGTPTGNTDIIRLAATPTGAGYYLLDASGQVLGFGDAPVWGSPLGTGLDVDIIGMTIRA